MGHKYAVTLCSDRSGVELRLWSHRVDQVTNTTRSRHLLCLASTKSWASTTLILRVAEAMSFFPHGYAVVSVELRCCTPAGCAR